MYTRFLPHIQPDDAVIFVTYRLDFVFRKSYVDQNDVVTLKSQMKKEIKENPQNRKKIFSEYDFKIFMLEDTYFPKLISSPQWLKNKEVASVIESNLLLMNQKQYDLFSYCIMPNHVHILIRPLKKMGTEKFFSLPEIMNSHKRVTARKANKILNRKGIFWYREFYDHYIRNNKEFENVTRYIYENPVKAGLVNEPEEWEFNKILEM